MEDVLPTEAGGLAMLRSKANPMQSYRASERSYQELKPYGIVCRVFGTKRLAFEALVVASNSIDSFHDPEGCLPGYGWDIVESYDLKCPTRTRGLVPTRVLWMKTPLGMRLGAVCYKGFEGFTSNHDRFAWNWMRGQLKDGSAEEGAFYRFIQLSGPASEKALQRFVGDFLDAAGRNGQGVL